MNEHFFAKEINSIAALVRTDCDSDSLAIELAKRIIDYERNEAFLLSQRGQDFHEEVHDWARSPQRMALAGLSQSHQNKERVEVTFTTSNKKPKGKERTEEIKFIEDFLKLQDKALLGKARAASNRLETSQRYQKRAINQLVKGVRAVAAGEVL